nr:hypothetical protein [Tanacetum cinerariifolium]
MGEPLSPDRVFDFPTDEPELHSAYDFFAPGLLPGYAGNRKNNNGWIEADVSLLREMGAVADEPMVGPIVDEIDEPVDEAEEQVIASIVGMDEDIAILFGDDDFEDDDFSDEDSKGVEEEEVWEVNEEWLMAPVTPPLMPAVQPPSIYKVGGPSTAAIEGPSFPLIAPGLPIPPSVIEDLSTPLGNLEYKHRKLVKKVIQVSDVEVAAGVSIGEIGPRRHADSVAAGYSFRVEQAGEHTDAVYFGIGEAVGNKMLQGIPTASYDDPTASALCHWLMYTIVWRNRDDVDTMSLDDVYNHLKVYESEVQKKSESNSQNMAFISSSNTSSGKGKVYTASVPTASIQVSTASTDIAAASLSHDTVCAYIATQSNGSQIKYKDITQIDKDDIEEMDIKWNVALLSMRVDRFWKKTGKKITIQGSDVAGFDKSKVECFNCHKIGHFARECRAPRSQAKCKRESYKQGPKEEELAPKALMAIDGIGWDWSYMANEEENHALVADDEVSTEFTLMAKSSSSLENENELEHVKKEKESLDNKLTGFEDASKDLDNLLGSQRSDKNNEGLSEFVDDTVTDYSWPTPSIDASKCNESELQSSKFSVFEHGESSCSILSKPMIKFVKEADYPRVIKTNKTKNARKSHVKYAEIYRNISKGPKVKGNQQNWNNIKTQQLGKDFLMQNKACFKCGYFDHLASNYDVWVEKEKIWPKDNYAHKRMTPRAVLLKHGTTPIVVSRPNMNVAQPKMTSFAKIAHSNVKRPFQGKSAVRTQPRVPRVSNVTKNFPIVDLKFPTAKSTFTADLGNKGKAVKASACWIWRPKQNTTEKGQNCNGVSVTFKKYQYIDTQGKLKSVPYDGGYVSFGHGGGKITGKGIIKTDFKLKDDTNVLLRTPRQHDMYSIDLNNIVPHKNLTCLVTKALVNESMLWNRRLGHLNFKTMNKLVRNNLVKGLPSKCFENDHTCVACLKGKQHKASCKTKLVNYVSKPLHTLYMDLFGPTSVSSLNHKWYCLVVTDDFSRFTWTFFLRTKDETSSILRNFITEIENLKDLKVKIIREFNNARTPQQNGVTERRNKTLIEAARTMLADAKLPVTFWAEAVNTACYVRNRVLVNKSQNKTPYELFNSIIHGIGFLRPFGCHVMILNSLDHLGKFDAKGDECYFAGYSLSSKAFRVFNKRTKKVEENLHVDFLENKLIVKGAGPNWLFDIDTLTNSMNYVPVVVAETSSTNISAHMETRNNDAPDGCNVDVPESSGISNPTATSKVPSANQVEPAISLTVESEIPTVSSLVPTVCLDISPESLSGPRLITKMDFSQKETPSLGNALTLSNRFEDTFGVEADLSNMETSIPVSPAPTFRIHKDHLKSQIISPVDTHVQTRYKSKEMEEQKAMQEELLQFKIQNVWVLVDCPKRVRPIDTKWVLKNKKDERGIVIRNKARLVAQGYTQEEGIDYEEVFAPVAKIEAIRLFLAYASFMGFIVYQMDVKSAFLYGTINKEVYVMQPPGFQDPEFPDRVYKVEKAMYGLHQAPRALYGTLSKYLLDNGFQRGTINQTLFIQKHKGDFLLVQVYVDDIIFGSSNPKLCKEFKALMHDKFQMSVMGELTFFLGLQVLQKKDGIFLSQEKYVGDILKKFEYSDVRSANTPMDKENPWGKIDLTIVATSTTEAEYVAAASGCGQVIWIQNQMLDYGYIS